MEISAIWLRTEPESIVVLIEVDDKWYRLIDEYCPEEREMVISYIAELKNGLPSNATLEED